MRRPANTFRAGIVTLAAVLAVIVIAMAINVSFGLPFNLSLLPPGQDYAIKAAFEDANGVSRGADVVIAGHSVGQVTGVEVSGTRAVVTMRVGSRYAPLHRFSTARIRWIRKRVRASRPSSSRPPVGWRGSSKPSMTCWRS
jgi:ABC-type transporter Mla subunit MlaD